MWKRRTIIKKWMYKLITYYMYMYSFYRFCHVQNDMKRIVTELAFDFKKINAFFISWKVHWYKDWIQIRILVISTYKNVLTLLNFPTWPKYFRRQNKPYQEFIREKVMAIKKSYLIPKNFKILLLKQQVFCFD